MRRAATVVATMAVAGLLLGGCGSSGGSTAESPAPLASPVTVGLEGTLTGQVQFGGEGNHDGLVNAKGCNEDQDVPDYYKVTTYTSGEGDAGELGTVTVEMAHCTSDAGPQAGQVAITTADGDTLYGEYTGEYSGGGGPDTVTITFRSANTQDDCFLLGADEGTVQCRSTGRFADATGTATMLVSAQQTDPADPFVPWSFEGTWQDAAVTYTP